MEHLPIVVCSECGVGITNPRPPVTKISCFYPDDYGCHAEVRQTRLSILKDKLLSYKCGYPHSENLIARMLWTLIGFGLGGFIQFELPFIGPNRRLLDVGCGSGSVLKRARSWGWEVYGVELNSAAAKKAREFVGTENVWTGTLESAPFPANFFDCITLIQVLEHLYYPAATLAHCHRLLRTGGIAIISVPNFKSLPSLIMRDYWNGLQLPTHLYHYSPSVLVKLAETQQLTVLRIVFASRITSMLLNMRSLRAALAFQKKNNRNFSSLSYLCELMKRIPVSISGDCPTLADQVQITLVKV